MAFGDILVRHHFGFKHFAFEGPMGRAIEYTKRYGPPRVTLTTVQDVCNGGGPTTRSPYPANAVYTPVQAWQRLYSRLGEQRYSVTDNNCESLVNWAIYGDPLSQQGRELAAMGAVAVGVSAIALLVAVLDG